MQKKSVFFVSIFLCLCANLMAQDSTNLLALLGNEAPQKQYVTSTFKSSRVIMSHSVEMLKPGVLDFRILHRFGNINRGVAEFFGLDQANGIRLGLDYGVSKNFTVGIGRSSIKKEIDGFLKYRVAQQSTGPKSVPFSLVVVGGSTLNTLKFSDNTRKNLFSSRIGYYTQVLVGRKFSEAFSLQIMPTMVHQNLVTLNQDPNDIYAAGIGGRIKLSRRVSLNADYYYVINQTPNLLLHNPLSIGFDLETGGHVFQLHFSNAIGMNERVFITETTNNFFDGDIGFGFNISRSFQLKKKKF